MLLTGKRGRVEAKPCKTFTSNLINVGDLIVQQLYFISAVFLFIILVDMFASQNSLLSGTTFHLPPRNPVRHSPESTLLNSNPPMRCRHHMADPDWLEGMNDAF